MAALLRREMRREACALWITPFEAALEMARMAEVIGLADAAALPGAFATLVRDLDSPYRVS